MKFFKLMTSQKHSQMGAVLVTLLVIIGIIVVIFAAIQTNLSNSIKLQAKVNYETDTLAISRYVWSLFSCDLTRANITVPCTVGSQVEGWGYDNQGKAAVLISGNSSSPTIAFGYEIRIRCESCSNCPGNRRLVFEGYKPGNDALSGFQRGWVNLFKGGTLPCNVGEI